MRADGGVAVAGAPSQLGVVWGFLSGMLWGIDGVVLGVALGMAPFVGAGSLLAPLVVAALHDGLAALWMLVYNAGARRLTSLPRSLFSRPGLVLCGAALLGGPIAMSGYLFGIRYAGAAYAMAISATFPAVGAVLSRIFLKERVTRLGWLGVALAVCGAVIVTYTPPVGEALNFYLGIAFAAIATVGWGLEGVLAIHSMRAIAPTVAGNLRMLTSFVVYVAVVLPLAGELGTLAAAFGGPSFWVVLAGAAAGAGSYLAYYAANHLVGASRAMPLNSTYAVWAIVFGIVLTGFHPTPQLVIGVVVTLLGAVFVVSGAPRSAGSGLPPAAR